MAKPASIPPKKFRAIVSKATETVYQAECDGFVNCFGYITGGAGFTVVLSDSANPPGTIIDGIAGNDTWPNGLCCRIKKGDYWKVTQSNLASNVYWTPMK